MLFPIQTLRMEVKLKVTHKHNRGQRAQGINPQGYAQDEHTPDPKTKLENAAKRSNTK